MIALLHSIDEQRLALTQNHTLAAPDAVILARIMHPSIHGNIREGLTEGIAASFFPSDIPHLVQDGFTYPNIVGRPPPRHITLMASRASTYSYSDLEGESTDQEDEATNIENEATVSDNAVTDATDAPPKYKTETLRKAKLWQPKLREVLDQYRRDDEEAKNAWWEKVNEISSDSKAQAGLWHKYKSKKCTKNRYADRLKP